MYENTTKGGWAVVIAGSWSARRYQRHDRRARRSGALRAAWTAWAVWLGGWITLQRNASGMNVTTNLSESSDASAGADVPAPPTFEAFFRRHEREIFGYLWRMTGDEQAAYDLSQETFVRAWQRFDRIASYDRPGAWLFRVATNLALTHQKRAAAPVGAARSFSAGVDPAVSDPAWRLAESDAVRRALLALAPQQRAALVLREVYGFSCAEVAEALGVTLAAAKMTLSRSRDAFRTRYTRQEEQP